ncbi:MAG: glycosyltransferase family 4 protein [Flavobacteriales bacterium]|nr:glycosyltransferase family 4 protein [Flavobacteriales bacterium]
MRIALIHYRLLRKGGLETRLFNYLNYYSSKGHQVHLIVSKIDADLIIPTSIKIHQVNLKRVPKPIRMWFFNKGLKDIMAENSFDLSISLGRTSHQDLVMCPGTHLGYMKALNFRFQGPIDRMNVYLDKLAYRDSKLVLAASEQVKDELRNYANVPESKIRVLYPPTDTNKFNQSGIHRKREWRDKYGFSNTKKSLLFVTTGNHLKGYDFLLTLMAKLVDEPIELIIAGVKPIQTDLKNVKYLGYSENVNELMWAADALVHPAKYEAYAQVVSESLLCGLPVLVSHMVGAKSVVTEDVGIVVNSFNEELWLSAIQDILNRNWCIDPNFSELHGLTVERHCERILQLGMEAVKPR